MWLEEDAKLPRPRRRTAHRLFEGLQEIGYGGAYDSVQRFVKRWKSTKHGPKLTEAFVPLLFQPGDACQFDWSQQVELGGVVQTIKGAYFRLSYSRLRAKHGSKKPIVVSEITRLLQFDMGQSKSAPWVKFESAPTDVYQIDEIYRTSLR